MASVSGNLKVKRAPAPRVLASSMIPPTRATLLATTSRPMPRPEMLVTAAAVEKPGAMMRRKISASFIAASASAPTSPFCRAALRILSTSSPRPSSPISTISEPASCQART